MVLEEREIREAVKAYIEEARCYAEEALRVCVSCGVCLSACTTYNATRDARLSPPYRLRAAVKALRGEKLSEDEVVSLYTCNICGACTRACPFSIEVLRVVHAARICLARRGVIPSSLAKVSEAARRSGHSFLADRSEAEKRLRETASKAGIEPGASGDVLYAPTPFDTTLYPTILPSVVKLLRDAGLEPTVSVRVLDAGGNAGIDANDLEAGLMLLATALEEAEKLGAEMVVVGPCGSDWKLVLLADELGLLPAKPRVTCIYELLASRGVRVECRDCLLFTSCTYARLDPTKSLVKVAVAKPPRDKPPYTRCCGGAGGLNYLHEEPYASIRRKVVKWRFEMLAANARGKTILIPCVKCYAAFKQGALLAKKPLYPMKLLVEYMAARGSASQP